MFFFALLSHLNDNYCGFHTYLHPMNVLSVKALNTVSGGEHAGTVYLDYLTEGNSLTHAQGGAQL